MVNCLFTSWLRWRFPNLYHYLIIITLFIYYHYRYFAIIYPFRPLLWLKRHKIAIIAFIWLLGFMIASPQLLYTRTIEFGYKGQLLYDCRENFTEEGGKTYTIFVFMVTFFIPIMTLIFVYSAIAIHLMRNSSAPGNPDQNRDKVCITKKIKVRRRKYSKKKKRLIYLSIW